ncbi:hypothetical protein OHB12_16830 [Nocardia sp. NBC_01730]|nr:hypothetical protein OHB12_16830 [Nocardia sp. NBC_01730]
MTATPPTPPNAHRPGRFATIACREHPNLCREFRWHVDHGFTIVDQVMRDMSADAVTALDRPHPIRVSLCGGQHFAVAGVVGAVSARGQYLAGGVDDLDRG